MKDFIYWGKKDEYTLELVNERVEEEGCGRSNTLKYLIRVGLGVSDPREGEVGRDEQAGTLGTSLRLIPPLWAAIDIDRHKRGLKMAACIRAVLMEHYGVEPPPKVKRAPRNRALSADAIMGQQQDSYNDMRNLRISQEGQPPERQVPVWERIRLHPTEMFLVNLCRVKGCHNEDLGLHKHAGNQLLRYSDAVEAGGRT